MKGPVPSGSEPFFLNPELNRRSDSAKIVNFGLNRSPVQKRFSSRSRQVRTGTEPKLQVKIVFFESEFVRSIQRYLLCRNNNIILIVTNVSQTRIIQTLVKALNMFSSSLRCGDLSILVARTKKLKSFKPGFWLQAITPLCASESTSGEGMFRRCCRALG